MELPMLDEAEFAQVSRLFMRLPRSQMLEAYARLTGLDESNPAAIITTASRSSGRRAKAAASP